MIKAAHSFPPGFIWGTSTASFQVEGRNENADWFAWESVPGRIRGGDRSGLACDWWGGRWKEDLERAASGGQNAHRLSLAWDRLEPRPGEWDEEALQKYRSILEHMRTLGMRPLVTLHHFSHPQWFMEEGGWLASDAPARFARMVRWSVEKLADLCAFWITINEPLVYAYSAYSAGLFPPGGRSIRDAVRAIVHLVQAHAAAYHVIHEIQANALVGVAHHYRSMQAARSWNPLDVSVSNLRSWVLNDIFPVACSHGIVRFPWRSYPVLEAKGTQDFFGLNYFTQVRVRFDLNSAAELFGKDEVPQDTELGSSGFIANEPLGFWRALKWANESGLPILVTENGVDDDSDRLRPDYLAVHIRQLWNAVNFNFPVKGYFHWTLVDNFEWERGWSQRFGLWALDPMTGNRTKRSSAEFYGRICRENGLSSEMVQGFAPEMLPTLFPDHGPATFVD